MSSEIQRILILCREFPPFIGGAATYAASLAKVLAESGVGVDVITIAYPGVVAIGDGEALPPTIRIECLKFVPKFYLLAMAWATRRALSRQRYDAFVLADSSALKVAAMFSRIRHANTWGVFHGTEMRTFGRSQSLAFRLGIGRSRFVEMLGRLRGGIAVSHDLRRKILAEFDDASVNIEVVPHGVDVQFFTPLPSTSLDRVRAEHGLPDFGPILFSASRLAAEKGHDVLIDAMDRLIAEFPRIVLLIGGSGPNRENLSRRIHAAGIEEHVRMLGPLSREEMRAYYRIADLFVLPSEEESFGLVFIEANACGTFVVSGNRGGVTEVVRNGINGFAISPYDPAEIADAIRRV